MNLRRSILTAGAAALLMTSAAPLGAATRSTAPAEPQTLAEKIVALKRAGLMSEAQQNLARGWRAAHPKRKKLPHGLRLIPEREFEAGVPVHDAGLRSRAARAATIASSIPQASAFGTNLRANDPTGDAFPDAGQSEASVAANGNNMVVAWNDGNGFDLTTPAYQLLGYGISTNSGATWTDKGALPQGSGHPNWEWTSDPVVVVNSTTGDFYCAGLVYPDGPPPPDGSGTTNGIAVVKGSFSGSTFTWGTPVLVQSGSNASFFFDKEWIAVDPANGNVYLTYTKFTFSGDEIDFTRSTNGGASWSSPTKLSAVGDDGWVQGSRVVVGPSDEVYTVWQVIGHPTVVSDFFRMRKSTNLGVTFLAEVQAADYYSNFSTGAPGFNRERGITYPSLAVDRTNGANRGRVYIAWNECLNFYQDLDNVGIGTGHPISENEASNAHGADDAFASARAFTLGDTLRGTISDITTDLDFFKFNATQGQTCIFFVDSLSSGLDMAFRLFCSDTTTRLALSSPGIGLGSLIVWTCPASGTYYVRPAAWSTSDPGPHPYRIFTAIHHPDGTDRARDQRDVFVASSSNGLTWNTSGLGAPTRVNDDAALYDDWLPEVAVTGDSHVFCTWFDWRDAAPTACGGESNLYLYRSDNGGQSWANLGLITDAKSSWTSVQSNVAPNQGDYIALFANATTVIPVWGDGRDGDPNVYLVPILATTPTLASLATSVVESGRVTLDWLATEWANQSASLERRDGSGAGWSAIADHLVDADGHVRFVDVTVSAGRTYDYRLAFSGSAGPVYSSQAEITVPAGAALALRSPQPNPAVNDLWIGFSLPSAERATLSLIDIAGREVERRDVGGLGAGDHRVNLAEGRQLPAGVYIVKLQQGARTLTTRASVVR